MSCSASTFERPYGVTGPYSAPSSGISSWPALPYRMHDDANMKRDTPASLAFSAHPHQGEMVDVIGGLRIEVADRIVADGSEE
jgi:hypothetical protein